MFEHNSSMRFNVLNWAIIILFISVFTCINCTATETISENKWSNENDHSLSANTYDYKSNDNTMDTNPVNEGFIVLSDNQKKHPSPTISSTSSTTKKQISSSRTLSNITAIKTSKTKHQTASISTSRTGTKTVKRTLDHTGNLDKSPARRGRRLLNDLSYDTDIDTSATNTSLDQVSDVDSFLAVNSEDLSAQLINMALTVDGSGFTTEDTTEETSTTTSESTITVSTTGITPTTTNFVTQESTETIPSETVTFTQLSTGSESSTTTIYEESTGSSAQDITTTETTTTNTQVISTIGQSTTNEPTVIEITEESSAAPTEITSISDTSTTVTISATTYTQITSEISGETDLTVQSSTTTTIVTVTSPTEFTSVLTEETGQSSTFSTNVPFTSTSEIISTGSTSETIVRTDETVASSTTTVSPISVSIETTTSAGVDTISSTTITTMASGTETTVTTETTNIFTQSIMTTPTESTGIEITTIGASTTSAEVTITETTKTGTVSMTPELTATTLPTTNMLGSETTATSLEMSTATLPTGTESITSISEITVIGTGTISSTAVTTNTNTVTSISEVTGTGYTTSVSETLETETSTTTITQTTGSTASGTFSEILGTEATIISTATAMTATETLTVTSAQTTATSISTISSEATGTGTATTAITIMTATETSVTSPVTDTASTGIMTSTITQVTSSSTSITISDIIGTEITTPAITLSTSSITVTGINPTTITEVTISETDTTTSRTETIPTITITVTSEIIETGSSITVTQLTGTATSITIFEVTGTGTTTMTASIAETIATGITTATTSQIMNTGITTATSEVVVIESSTALAITVTSGTEASTISQNTEITSTGTTITSSIVTGTGTSSIASEITPVETSTSISTEGTATTTLATAITSTGIIVTLSEVTETQSTTISSVAGTTTITSITGTESIISTSGTTTATASEITVTEITTATIPTMTGTETSVTPSTTETSSVLTSTTMVSTVTASEIPTTSANTGITATATESLITGTSAEFPTSVTATSTSATVITETIGTGTTAAATTAFITVTETSGTEILTSSSVTQVIGTTVTSTEITSSEITTGTTELINTGISTTAVEYASTATSGTTLTTELPSIQTSTVTFMPTDTETSTTTSPTGTIVTGTTTITPEATVSELTTPSITSVSGTESSTTSANTLVRGTGTSTATTAEVTGTGSTTTVITTEFTGTESTTATTVEFTGTGFTTATTAEFTGTGTSSATTAEITGTGSTATTTSSEFTGTGSSTTTFSTGITGSETVLINTEATGTGSATTPSITQITSSVTTITISETTTSDTSTASSITQITNVDTSTIISSRVTETGTGTTSSNTGFTDTTASTTIPAVTRTEISTSATVTITEVTAIETTAGTSGITVTEVSTGTSGITATEITTITSGTTATEITTGTTGATVTEITTGTSGATVTAITTGTSGITMTATSTIVTITQTTATGSTTASTTSVTTATSIAPIVCTSKQESVSPCTAANSSNGCNSADVGYQIIETTYTCSNSSRSILTRTSMNCSLTCPVTEVTFNDTPSEINLNMRMTAVPLPFSYQYTNETVSHKILWVADKGYITLDKPLYAIEPSQNDLPDVPYIAPFWTNLIYVNQTTLIQPVIYNGLSLGSEVLGKVEQTIAQQNQTLVNNEGIVYRVIKISWQNLIANIDNNTKLAAKANFYKLAFDAYLINGPGNDFSVWNSYLRFEYDISTDVVSTDYQPVVIGYHTAGDTSHKSSVSFTDKVSSFIQGSNTSKSYFLSSRLLSTCEQWYWKKYTEILYQPTLNLTTVKRNPCPCSYTQALSDFRFYQMNSENRFERSYNISCFVPLSEFIQRTSDSTVYQQTCCYDTYETSLITSGEFAGSVLDDSALQSLRYITNQPQRIKERDECCIASSGTIDWSSWCNLYYQIRPPSTCDGYAPPSQAWFGGDPHIQTLNNTDYSCNIFGSFVYAETNSNANITGKAAEIPESIYVKDLVSNELFSIVARTSKTPALLQVTNFFNQNMTYFSSFSMYLGSMNDVIIDVDINTANSYQFRIKYFVRNGNITGNPFNLPNDYVEYFYYPINLTNDSSQLPFSIIKENQTISATSWKTYNSAKQNTSIQIQVPRLTISVWSGLAIQCYLITNNMACTLLLPQKYQDLVQGLAFGDITGDANQYCASQSLLMSKAESLIVNSSSVETWFRTSASNVYRDYINQVACPLNQSSPTYKFCVQDTILSQSSLLGQLTVKSSSDYQLADRSLTINPPKITLVLPTSFDTPYTYLLTIPYTATFQNNTYQYIDVTIDRTSSILVQLRDGNTSALRDCFYRNPYYSCPFLYTNDNRDSIQLTIIATDTSSNLVTYQRIQLIVNECMDGTPIWGNPTILSSSVVVLFCLCTDRSAGTYCERLVGCTDMTACQLNFRSNMTCITNMTGITINITRAPYFCVDQTTEQICTNNSECCRSGYDFSDDVQQCLFRSVCNDTVCGANGTCQNSELKPNGYICSCDSTAVFNGTTCAQKKICDNPATNAGSLLCTGKFEVGRDSGNECICQCQSGFTNTSTGCIGTSIICNDTTNICYNTSTPLVYFCQYRTQIYDGINNRCQNTLCLNYCQNGICLANQTEYSCICPPGTSLDYALNCAVCSDGLAGPNCSLICDCEFGTCNINATNENNKCTCATGYTGSQCDQYINFCASNSDKCQTSLTHKLCTLSPTNRDTAANSTGYDCTCMTGYTNDSASICQDINECAVAPDAENICPADTTVCVNYPGGYSCSCIAGYMKQNSSSTGACVDIDECSVDPLICSEYNDSYCVNVSPGYQCRCDYGYAPNGNFDEMYVALNTGQTCQPYDQCAAAYIDCGGGKCSNRTSTDSRPSCYCDSPLVLFSISEGKFDCVCPSESYYYSDGKCIDRPDQGGLSGLSIFHIDIYCNSSIDIINEIRTRFAAMFTQPYILNIANDSLVCDQNNHLGVSINISTDSNITIQTNVFAILANITDSLGGQLTTIGKCLNKTEIVTNVTSCYLFDLCDLCGTNPRRGVCLPETHLSQCRCFTNTNDTSKPYAGEFCLPTTSLSSPSASLPPRWTPIVIGVLAGLAGLFCAITCCLLAVAVWRRRRQPRAEGEDFRFRRIWHLPRAQVPTTVTAENVQTYLNSSSTISTISTEPEDSTLNSDHSTYRTTYDQDPNGSVNSTFFKQLDQTMGAKLRATITRPDTNALLSSLPTVATGSSSLSTTATSSTDDPIDELDAIIDDEDITMTFHDPLDDLFEDDDILEVINPNLKIPRAHVDPPATGVFSFFNRH